LKQQSANKIPQQAGFDQPRWNVLDVLFVQRWHIGPVASRFKVVSRVVANVEPNNVHQAGEIP
tara:strand:- start:61 stop:249 length:189 start_codon:yes stop_codon:yes gene_type:complete